MKHEVYKNRKKIISLFLILSMVIGNFSMPVRAENVPAQKVNAVGNSEVVNDALDLTKLDGWYVYDHYDTKTGGYSKNDPMFTDKKPYFPVTESASKDKNLYTIDKVISEKFPLNKAYTLKEHIKAIKYPDRTDLYFLGYGNAGKTTGTPHNNDSTDFLIYPSQEKGKKRVNYTVDASNVIVHAMKGAGFLLNSGIDTEGNIHGYVLYFQYTKKGSGKGDPADDAKVFLYKIKENIKATDFHTRTTYSVTDTKYMTQIATVDNFKFSTYMNINIVFNNSVLEVTTQELSSVTDKNPSKQPVTLAFSTVPNLNTGYYGFGPLTDMTKEGHTCEYGSTFIFVDLTMTETSFVGKDGISKTGGNGFSNEQIDALTNLTVFDCNGDKITDGTITPNEEQLAAINKAKTEGKVGKFPLAFTYVPQNQEETPKTTTIYIYLRETGEDGATIDPENPQAQLGANDASSQTGGAAFTKDQIIALTGVKAKDADGNIAAVTDITIDETEFKVINDAKIASQVGDYPLTYTYQNKTVTSYNFSSYRWRYA